MELPSTWREAYDMVPQGSVSGPVLFNSFISDIDEVIEGEHSAGNTKLRGIANRLEVRPKMQTDLDN